MRCPISQLVLSFLLLIPSCMLVAQPVVIYVSTSIGNNRWTGEFQFPRTNHSDGPLATIAAARDRLRFLASVGKIPKDGAVVKIAPGLYPVTEPIMLTKADDFNGLSVTYEDGGVAPVCISGGKQIIGWKPAADPAILGRLKPEARTHLYVVNLLTCGVSNFGKITSRGFYSANNTPWTLELFCKDRPMTIARWPNSGSWASVESVPNGSTTSYQYETDEPSTWKQTGDIWVHGYFGFDWADSYNLISSIDKTAHVIAVAPPPPFGMVKDHRWYALNVLEELDTPGEYYLDRQTGNLYFWPPSIRSLNDTRVSIADSLLNASGVSNLTIHGIEFDQCRGIALSIAGGHNDTISNCVVRNTGSSGALVDGTNQSMVHCKIEDIGESGVEISGGNRTTLTRSNNSVTDCVIDRYSRVCRTYRPGVKISGVGIKVSHNHIFYAPHQAILLSGNDNLIQYNEIDHVCQETGDAGAFYMGRNWTCRGNIVDSNYFHDIGGASGLVGYHETMSVYLDDMACGTTVTNNLFVNASHGVMVGGGRDNIVKNNIFVHCSPAFSLDARGLTWASKYLVPGGGWYVQESLAEVSYDKPPYSTEYPNLASMPLDNPGQPKGDVFDYNVVYECPNWLILDALAKPGLEQKSNLIDLDPDFENKNEGDFRFLAQSPAIKLGIKQLNLNDFGPRTASSAP